MYIFKTHQQKTAHKGQREGGQLLKNMNDMTAGNISGELLV